MAELGFEQKRILLSVCPRVSGECVVQRTT